jgi:serine protease inhibitor
MRFFVNVRTSACAATACVMLATAATSAQPVSPQPAMPAAQPAGTMKVEHAYNQFGFDVLRELRAERADANVFISPASIAIALAMVANGAEGETRAAILGTLGLQGEPIGALNAANQALVVPLNESQSVQLAIANAVWIKQGFAVEPAFKTNLETQYSAQVENLDFQSSAAVPSINAWVAKHTHDRIRKILDSIDPATVVLLANAVAFKGKWTLQFDPKATQPHDFTLPEGSAQSVAMMQNTARYAYANANGLETIRLPYSDESFAMYVVLPQDKVAMDAFLHGLTPDTFETLRSSLESKRGTIELPRFSIDYETSLNAMLAKLGMGIAFGNAANFDGIHPAPPPIHISEVRHASFLKVDEEGTEAAAVTSISMRTSAIALERPFHMIVDRPFFLAIRDERSGLIIFSGTIAKPNE